MRHLEHAVVDDGVETWLSLMEHAGLGVAQEALAILGNAQGKQVLVLIGPGNNGGDGLVVARHLHDAGARVFLYIWNRTGYEDVNWQRCHQRNIAETKAEDDSDSYILTSLLSQSEMVIDALLGMGISRDVTGKLAYIVKTVNTFCQQQQQKASRCRPGATTRQSAQQATPLVLAIDVPTGIHSDTGVVMSVAIQAHKTVATGLIKQGLLRYPGYHYAGILSVADIGIPTDKVENIMKETITRAQVSALMPKRPADSHKGTFGKVMVIAGSLFYPGAAVLSTAGAARVGAGLVTLAAARSIINTTGRSPEITLIPLAEAEPGVLGARSAEDVFKHIENYQALLVGPGLGKEEATCHFFCRLLDIEYQPSKPRAGFRIGSEEGEHTTTSRSSSSSSTPVGFRFTKAESTSPDDKPEDDEEEHGDKVPEMPPMVIDADGLNILAEIEDWQTNMPQEKCILTPHPGEMKRLLKVEELGDDSIQVTIDAAKAWGQVVVLKGATTIIAAPDGRCHIHTEGNPALATAGTGDVLAGAIAGLLAQGLSLFDAATVGVYLHAAAGERVRESMGDAGALASDLLPRLPYAIKSLKE